METGRSQHGAASEPATGGVEPSSQSGSGLAGHQLQAPASSFFAQSFAQSISKPAPLDLSIDRGESFSIWKRRWTSYYRLSGLAQQDKVMAYDILISCLADETLKVVDNFELSDEDEFNVEVIISKLERYAKGQLNETVEHHNLLSRTQQDGERFDHFYTELRELSRTCSFCDGCKKIVLRDCLVRGVQSPSLRRKILSESGLTLDKAVLTCQAAETADIHHAEMERMTTCRRVQHSRNTDNLPSPDPPCGYCGKGPHPRAACPARHVTCSKCGKFGHYAKVCRSKADFPAPLLPRRVATLIAATKKAHAPTVKVQVVTQSGRSVTVEAIPDTGADVSAAGPEILALLGESTLNLMSSSETPQSADGSEMTVLGSMPVTVSLGDQSTKTQIFVIKNLQGVLLSWEATRDLAIVPRDYPKQIHRIDGQAKEATSTKQRSTREQLIAEFPRVFDGVLRVMPGELFQIHLQDDARPFCVNTPRRIPLAYREPLKKQLDSLQEQGIIVPVTAPAKWCSPIVVVPKKTPGEVRLCVDFTHLNKYIVRETYQSPTPHECVSSISATRAKVFSSFDALKGYHQCPLDPESQDLTTFITPFGRFKYLRAPFGLSNISEHYNRRMTEALDGLDGFKRVVDDVVVYDATVEQHENHIRAFLQRCSERGISLNADKFRYAEEQLKFAGFILMNGEYRIDPALAEGIAKFPIPKNITELRSFMGLVNQLGSFTPDVATHTEPLRALLSKKNEFVWTADHDAAFVKARAALSVPPALAYFDGSKPLMLHTDASRQHGLGFVLRQKVADSWRTVQAGSRFITTTESRYATIELEMLAIAWAVKKCHLYLAGQHFTIVTDHKPLLTILNSKRLDEIENTRLQRLRRFLMEYTFVASWCQGKFNAAADALSRSPVSAPESADELAEDSLSLAVRQVVTRSLHAEQLNLRLSAVQQATNDDPDLQSLITYIINGFPESKAELPPTLQPYWTVRDSLTEDDGIILHGCRIVVPSSMRRQILRELHNSHQGIERTKARARQTVFWPLLNNDVENVVRGCRECQRELPSLPKEPMIRHDDPSRPFEAMHADFGTYAGQQFLIAVDQYSSWPWVVQLGKTAAARHLIAALCEIFCTSGAPDTLYTDGGTQFSSQECQAFLRRWGVRHITSAPHYAQSNGRAEAAVKSMKKLIRRTWNFRRQRLDNEGWAAAITQYCNTPDVSGTSPAQRLFGRPLQDVIPAHHKAFAPEWQPRASTAERRRQHARQRQEQRYNATAHPLPQLTIGCQVAIQDPRSRLWDRYGTIVDIGGHRQYSVRLENGRFLVRNRRALRRRYAEASQTEPRPERVRVEQQACERPASPPQEREHSVDRVDEEVRDQQVVQEAGRCRRSTRQRRRPVRLIEEDSF